MIIENTDEDANRQMEAGKTAEDPGIDLHQGQRAKGDRSGRTWNRPGKMVDISESILCKGERIVDEADEKTMDL